MTSQQLIDRVENKVLIDIYPNVNNSVSGHSNGVVKCTTRGLGYDHIAIIVITICRTVAKVIYVSITICCCKTGNSITCSCRGCQEVTGVEFVWASQIRIASCM